MIFTLLHPTPTGENLHDVVAFPGGSALVVGDRATLLRVGPDGITRAPVPDVPTVADTFERIEKGSSADFPGTELMKGALRHIVARGPDDVWIQGGGGFVTHWDGRTWVSTTVEGTNLLTLDPAGGAWVWGEFCFSSAAPRHVDRVGDRLSVRTGPNAPCHGAVRALLSLGDRLIAATSERWMTSVGGEPFQVAPETASELVDLVAVGERVLRVGTYTATWDDGATLHRTGTDWYEGGAAIAGEAWLFGSGLWRGETPVPVKGLPKAALRLDADTIEAVDASGPDVWAVGAAGLIARGDANGLTNLSDRRFDGTIVGIVPQGAGWLAAADTGVLVNDRLEVVPDPLPGTNIDQLTTLGDGTLLAQGGCGEAAVLRSEWRVLPKLAEGCLRAVAGRDVTELWGIGTFDLDDGYVFSRTGDRWVRQRPFTAELQDVAVAADGAVWIVGEGLIARRQGGSFEVLTRHEYDTYRDVHIVAPDDVWIAGSSNEIGSAGLVLHWDGRAFHRYAHLTANFLDAITRAPDGTIWAVGLGGVGVRRRGDRWEHVDTGTSQWLGAILALPDGSVVAGGVEGVLIRGGP